MMDVKAEFKKLIGRILFVLCAQIIGFYLVQFFTGMRRNLWSFMSDYTIMTFWLTYLPLSIVIIIIKYRISKKGQAEDE
mgnify:FL=1